MVFVAKALYPRLVFQIPVVLFLNTPKPIAVLYLTESTIPAVTPFIPNRIGCVSVVPKKFDVVVPVFPLIFQAFAALPVAPLHIYIVSAAFISPTSKVPLPLASIPYSCFTPPVAQLAPAA
jgi:hypothetical protein